MPALDPCAALQAAESAYRDLSFGAAIREVRDQNGEMVSYSQGNVASLLSYMQRLQAACPSYVSPLLPQNTCASRPLMFLF